MIVDRNERNFSTSNIEPFRYRENEPIHDIVTQKINTLTEEEIRTHENDICIICNDNYTNNPTETDGLPIAVNEGEPDTLWRLSCNHVFHAYCLMSWFKISPDNRINPTCPIQDLFLVMYFKMLLVSVLEKKKKYKKKEFK